MEQTQRIQAQVTASLYLLGKTEDLSKFIVRSRESIYGIHDSICSSGFSSIHYFVMAKMIEHHTETHLFSEVSEVLKELKIYIEDSLNDEVFSLDEAVNKVIFHRDVYRAYRMLGDERCLEHLSIAEDIARNYNIEDQLKKIEVIKKEWEHIELVNDIEVKSKQKIPITAKPNKHKCNMKTPYFFISYSHKDAELIKLDIARCFSKYNYWVDYENLDGGRCINEPDWTEKVIPVLNNEMCKGVIVYCSPFSILQSVGALREAEWLEKNRYREIYVFLCGFKKSLKPQQAASYLEGIQVFDPVQSLRLKTAFKYILQATQSTEKYSYYFFLAQANT